MRLLLILSISLLAGCSAQTIKLNTYNQSYTQFKHIVDKRDTYAVFTVGDRVTRDLKNLARIADAGPYAAGTFEMDKGLLPFPDNKFSIPPALSLDMALDSLATKKNKTLGAFELTAIHIRSQYLLFGVPNLSNNAECEIYANYRDAKLWSTHTTTFSFGDFDNKMTTMVEQCINGIINRINYHDKRAESTSDIDK